MSLISTFLGVLGFVFGLPPGLVAGFHFFVYTQPKNVEDLKARPLRGLDTTVLQDILPEIPLWIKSPDYVRVDWLNKFLLDMWPYLDKAICANTRIVVEPIIAESIGKYSIEAIEFETLNPGTVPPSIQAMKNPMGILDAKVVCAIKLLKMDVLGTSDPYVKLTLSGDSHKRRNLNPGGMTPSLFLNKQNNV